MAKIKDMIVEVLREELEYQKQYSEYAQWVMGVRIREESPEDSPIGKQMYIARVLVMTNESPLVDGMDIIFMVPQDDVIIEANYFENTPDFQGGTVEDSIRWLGKDEMYYFQLENPFIKAVYSNH